MKNDVIIIILVVFFFVSMVLVLGYYERLTEIEMAKAGLQQCREGYATLWKKECKE